eukprot:g67524.t1
MCVRVAILATHALRVQERIPPGKVVLVPAAALSSLLPDFEQTGFRTTAEFAKQTTRCGFLAELLAALWVLPWGLAYPCQEYTSPGPAAASAGGSRFVFQLKFITSSSSSQPPQPSTSSSCLAVYFMLRESSGGGVQNQVLAAIYWPNALLAVRQGQDHTFSVITDTPLTSRPGGRIQVKCDITVIRHIEWVGHVHPSIANKPAGYVTQVEVKYGQSDFFLPASELRKMDVLLRVGPDQTGTSTFSPVEHALASRHIPPPTFHTHTFLNSIYEYCPIVNAADGHDAVTSTTRLVSTPTCFYDSPASLTVPVLAAAVDKIFGSGIALPFASAA